MVGAGLAVSVPSATVAAFGSHAFEIGPAWFAQTSALPRLDISMLIRTYFAVAGDVDAASVLSTKLEPGVVVALPRGLLLSCNPEIEIAWLARTYDVPVNLRLGHAIGDHVVVTAGPELAIAGRDRGDLAFDLQIDYVAP
jgi:hypothetical protein